MRPCQASEIKEHGLRILYLSRVDDDRLRSRDLMRRVDFEDWHASTWVRERGGEFQG
jgi:hypothetical protein